MSLVGSGGGYRAFVGMCGAMEALRDAGLLDTFTYNSGLSGSSWYVGLKTSKSSLYSRYCVEACNKWGGLSPRLSAWATQLRRNVAAVACRWRRCVRFDRPRIRTTNICSSDGRVVRASASGAVDLV